MPTSFAGPRGGLLYKLLPAADWHDAMDEVPWAPIDHQDGFLHLSAGHQVEETGRRYFSDVGEVVLLAIDPARIRSDALRWESSRGGDHFPHVYGIVLRKAVRRAVVLERGPNGALQFGPDVLPPG